MPLSNLPPGCSDRDIPGWSCNEICDCCGNRVDFCICPSCYICRFSHVGDPSCYEAGHLEYTEQQLLGREKYRSELRREDELFYQPEEEN